MKVKIITTGGTIDKIYFDSKSEFQVGEPQIAELLREANVTIDYEVQSLMRKDSLDLDDDDRLLIAEAVRTDPNQRIVITHGTDTMVATAQALQGISDKVVVLTGAMQPASLRLSDAVFNIGYAIAAVQLLQSGVHLAMNGHIFDAGNTRKNVELNRFETLGV